MVGESLPPTLGQRLLPELCLLLAGACGVGSLALLVVVPSHYGAPALLALAAAGLHRVRAQAGGQAGAPALRPALRHRDVAAGAPDLGALGHPDWRPSPSMT